MDAIGGYFELELRRGEHYHKDAIRLNTARNCFEYILMARKYRKVYIPYYTCEVMLQPLKRQQVDYSFYSIDLNLEPTEMIQLKEGEAFLYTNYFGLKQDCVERLAEVYGSRLIVDNAQAFFAPRISGIDTFYSPRKFFGVPDGGYLYTDCLIKQELDLDKSYHRMQHLFMRIDEGAEAGYELFKENESKLDNQPMMRMSLSTESILRSINYRQVREIRNDNYLYLEKHLKCTNTLKLQVKKNATVPMVYPYIAKGVVLREKLLSEKVYVAKYWPNIRKWCEGDNLSCTLSSEIIALPIDQRYSVGSLKRIVEIIKGS